MPLWKTILELVIDKIVKIVENEVKALKKIISRKNLNVMKIFYESMEVYLPFLETLFFDIPFDWSTDY